MSYSTKKSQSLFERAVKVLVEGGSSPSRGPVNYGDYPLFLERSQGAYVFDADNNKYIDWMMAYGGLPLGHAHPSIVKAVGDAMESGALLPAATQIEVEVAELEVRVGPVDAVEVNAVGIDVDADHADARALEHILTPAQHRVVAPASENRVTRLNVQEPDVAATDPAGDLGAIVDRQRSPGGIQADVA